MLDYSMEEDHSKLKRNLLLGGSVILLICVVIFVFSYITGLKLPFLSTVQKQPTLSNATTQTTTGSQGVFDPATCTFTTANKHLLSTLNTYPDVTVGTFTGSIQNVTSNSLTLVSSDQMQSYTFNINTSIPVYDKTNEAYLSFDSLAAGKKVVMQFNCNPATGNIFTITDIGVIQ